MSFLCATQYLTEDGRIHVHIKNVSGTAEGRTLAFTAVGREREDDSGPCSIICSLRSSHPHFFFCRLASDPTANIPLDRHASGDGPHQMQRSHGGPYQRSTGTWPLSSSPVSDDRSPRSIAEVVPPIRNATTVRTPASGRGKEEVCHGTTLQLALSSAATWLSLGMPTPHTHRSGDSILPHSTLHATMEEQPLLVNEVLPDDVLLPGESRSYVLDCHDVEDFMSILRQMAPAPSGAPQKHHAVGGGVASDRASLLTGKKHSSTTQPIGHSGHSVSSFCAAIDRDRRVGSTQEKTLIFQSPSRISGVNDPTSSTAAGAPQGTTDGGDSGNVTPLSISHDDEPPAHHRPLSDGKGGASHKPCGTDHPADQAGRATTTGCSEPSSDGRKYAPSCNEDDGDSAASGRRRRTIPTLYVFYRLLGNEYTCVQKAQQWVKKEKVKYHAWQLAYERAIVKLECQRQGLPLTAVPHRPADINVGEIVSDAAVMDAARSLRKLPKRIMPPALGEMVRWRSDGGVAACATGGAQSHGSNAFSYYYGGGVDSAQLTSSPPGHPSVTSREPKPFAMWHKRPLSKCDERFFCGDRFGGGTVVLPLHRKRLPHTSLPHRTSVGSALPAVPVAPFVPTPSSTPNVGHPSSARDLPQPAMPNSIWSGGGPALPEESGTKSFEERWIAVPRDGYVSTRTNGHRPACPSAVPNANLHVVPAGPNTRDDSAGSAKEPWLAPARTATLDPLSVAKLYQRTCPPSPEARQPRDMARGSTSLTEPIQLADEDVVLASPTSNRDGVVTSGPPFRGREANLTGVRERLRLTSDDAGVGARVGSARPTAAAAPSEEPNNDSMISTSIAKINHLLSYSTCLYAGEDGCFVDSCPESTMGSPATRKGVPPASRTHGVTNRPSASAANVESVRTRALRHTTAANSWLFGVCALILLQHVRSVVEAMTPFTTRFCVEARRHMPGATSAVVTFLQSFMFSPDNVRLLQTVVVPLVLMASVYMLVDIVMTGGGGVGGVDPFYGHEGI